MSLLEESYSASTPAASTMSQSSSPIESFTHRSPILAISTDLLIQIFDDRILVIVTQNGKIGCLTQASLPPMTPLPPPPSSSKSSKENENNSILALLPPPPTSLLLTPLLGSPPNPTLHELYVSQISTLIWWNLQSADLPRRPVIVALTLKSKTRKTSSDDDEEFGLDDEERERFAQIMELVSTWPGPS